MCVAVDPDCCDVPFLQVLDPGFEVRQAPLEGFRGPRLVSASATGTDVRQLAQHRRGGTTSRGLDGVEARALWRAHDALVARARDARGLEGSLSAGTVSLLDLKIELARRALRACRLCGHECRVDRLAGATGRCGLGADAVVAEAFVHVAEEPPINPALNLSLAGCGLRCQFCQQFLLLARRPAGSRPLDRTLWAELDLAAARSLAFVGGNPDESLYAILRFLRAAPANFGLPVVWNSHGFATELVYRLLDGVIDAYVPDFKYWDDRCAERWSAARGYRARATRGLQAMARQKVPVFVRVLILPGHETCCHRPVLEWLAAECRDRVRVNLMAQYHPEFRVKPGEGPPGRRPHAGEVERLRARALALGLALVE